MASKRMSKKRDVKVFKGTYGKTKRLNHAKSSMPGGIRL